ncbi:hypothetical protein ACFQY0_20695 [Haloferula chungangensis]|uniref:DUF2199 domain-containing protein n=1 Tax=Haloferula chungangensis TaxID=1048331 RepID=A0ABW2LDI2_9BACT
MKTEDGYPLFDEKRAPWPVFEEEGMECDVPSAKLIELDLVIALQATWTRDHKVPVYAWVRYEIEGPVIGPRWTYETCERWAEGQPFPDPHGERHLPWCDDGDCEWLASEPQNTRLRFHFLSCECEIDTQTWLPTGRKVWTRKRYVDYDEVRGVGVGHDDDLHYEWHIDEAGGFKRDTSTQAPFIERDLR